MKDYQHVELRCKQDCVTPKKKGKRSPKLKFLPLDKLYNILRVQKESIPLSSFSQSCCMSINNIGNLQ